MFYLYLLFVYLFCVIYFIGGDCLICDWYYLVYLYDCGVYGIYVLILLLLLLICCY